MSKIKVAGEIVAHCRKCGFDLTHIVVAMVNGVPKRVLCRTCNTEHAYHRPLEERGSARTASTQHSPRTSASPRAPSRAVAEAQSDAARERAWRDRIAGKPAHSFSLYSPKGAYSQDQLIHHPKFGDGFVARVIDAGKIEVWFHDGARTLAHGLSGH